MPAQKSSINLLSKTEFESSSIGRFLRWALTVGKYIVIITQLVVISAFVFRFKLDRDLEAINDSIAQHQAEVVSYQDLEHTIRVLQDQLATLKVISNNQVYVGQVLDALAQNTPLETELETLAISGDNLSLSGKTLTEVGLATLIAELQNEPQFTDIVVNSVTTGGAKDPSLTFTINAKIQTGQEEKP